MERILSTRDIAERYQCSLQCARNYIRKMVHMENPLMVYESELMAWEQSRMLVPAGRQATKVQTGRVIVPRKREG